MPELGKRLGVNKSTIQRYEADGVDPKRTMIIDGLADALLTTPEWLTGLSEDKEYDSYTALREGLWNSISRSILIQYDNVRTGRTAPTAPDHLPRKARLICMLCFATYFAACYDRG